MTEFVLRKNYFEFNGKVKQQILAIAIGIKCAPTYACIHMDDENEFLSLRRHKPLVWFRCTDGVFHYMDTWRQKTLQIYEGLK